MNELVLASSSNGHRPPVVSVVLKKRHAVRGIRLINRDSLITYLASLAPQAKGVGAVPSLVTPENSAIFCP